MSNAKLKNLLYGRHPVVDAIRSGKKLDKIILQKGLTGEVEKELRRLSKENDIPLQYLPKERLNKIAGGNHQGVVAWLSLIRYQNLEDILPHVYDKGEVPLILILDGITDVRNFGAIARTAEVAGAHAVIIPAKGSAQINAEAIKTSAGALNLVPVCKVKSLSNSVDYLKQSGITIFASDLEAEHSIYETDLTIPLAYVVGAEGEGISNHLRKIADKSLIIPQYGETDSLNVSVATGVMLFEALRQRSQAH